MPRTRSAAIVVIALTAAAAAGASSTREPAASTGVITGTIVDAADGRPVAGAIVAITSPAASPVRTGGPRPPTMPPTRVLTGTGGRFVFRELPLGSYTVTASKAGYATGGSGRGRPEGPMQTITLSGGERLADIVVPLWKLGSISGTVVDEAGEPVVGARIRAWRRGPLQGKPYLRIAGTAYADDRGVYHIGDLLAGEYVVGFSSPIVSAPSGMTGQATREMPSPPSSPGSYGGIQAGAVVYGLSRSGPVPPPPVGHWFSIYPATFHPAAIDPANAARITLGSGEERGSVDVAIQPVRATRVSGILVGPDGPASGTIVRAMPVFAEHISLEPDLPAARADAGGNFVFPALPAGTYSLQASHPPQAPTTSNASAPDQALWAHLPLDVGDTPVDGLVLTLQNGYRISGRVEFDGALERPTPERLASVPIAVEPAGMIPLVEIPRPSARIAANGRFTSVGLAPGRYFVRVLGSPPGWMFRSAQFEGRDLSQVPIDIRSTDVSGIVISFTDRWSGLSGQVHGATGSQDETAMVLVLPTDFQDWITFGPNPRRMRSMRAGRGGEYRFSSLPPGQYYVAAIPDEQAIDWLDSKFLDAVAREASKITINEGEHKVLDLRTQEIRQ